MNSNYIELLFGGGPEKKMKLECKRKTSSKIYKFLSQN